MCSGVPVCRDVEGLPTAKASRTGIFCGSVAFIVVGGSWALSKFDFLRRLARAAVASLFGKRLERPSGAPPNYLFFCFCLLLCLCKRARELSSDLT